MEKKNSLVRITGPAAKRIVTLMEKDGRTGNFFRIEVRGGGCQGFEYKLGIDTSADSEDEVFEQDGARIHIDRTSLVPLMGSEIDWVSSLAEEKFDIRNPNAISSCGCGVSFSL